jgi:chitosanase
LKNMSILKIFFLMLILICFTSPCSAGINTKNTILQITSALENDDTNLHYNYAENLKDGRGITFGIAGFCTGTYDGNEVIKYYTKLNPNNKLKKYIPALNKIDSLPHDDAYGGGGSSSVKGLNGFIKDVQNCKDPLFKQAQEDKRDEFYWYDTVDEFNRIGARYPITLAIMYDASVRYGINGMQEIVSKSGKISSDERAFDRRFIREYTKVLKEEGLADTDRMSGYSRLLNNGNVCLTTPFTFYAHSDQFIIC